MRIIAGNFRGRTLEVPADETIRPTSDKTRGAIFNILEHRAWPVHPLLATSHVADVFCGTGALGLEALSRGVKHVVFIDHSREALNLAKANIKKFNCTEQTTLINSDAGKISLQHRPFDLVMLDPPYHTGLATKALNQLDKQALLKTDTVIMIETAREEEVVLPAHFTRADERHYGDTKVSFYLYGKST